MIKLAEKKDIPCLTAFLGCSPVCLRISTLLSVYGTEYDFVKFFIQLDEKENVTAALSHMEGECTLYTGENADFEELSRFFDFTPCSSLTSERDTLLKTGITPDRTGDILSFSGDGEKSLRVNGDPDLKGVFALLLENEGESIGKLSYLPWLSDFTFRRNRHRARAFSIEENGETVCAAVTSAETEDAVLISGMVTKKEYRKRGCGKELLSHISYEMKKEGKTIYVMTAQRELNGFYRACGFKICGQWEMKEG